MHTLGVVVCSHMGTNIHPVISVIYAMRGLGKHLVIALMGMAKQAMHSNKKSD